MDRNNLEDGPLTTIHLYPNFSDLIKDKEFQKELYSAITNTEWIYTQYDEKQLVYDILKGNYQTWSVSFRGAGGLISKLYDAHTTGNPPTSYMNFYLCSPAGVVSERIEEIFNSLGWKLVPEHT